MSDEPVVLVQPDEMPSVVESKGIFVVRSSSNLGECPPNWLVGNNGTGCYFVSATTQLNFTDASSWCQSSQSRLIEIVETKLFDALQSLNDFHFRLNDFFWVGLRELGPNRSSLIRLDVHLDVALFSRRLPLGDVRLSLFHLVVLLFGSTGASAQLLFPTNRSMRGSERSNEQFDVSR